MRKVLLTVAAMALMGGSLPVVVQQTTAQEQPATLEIADGLQAAAVGACSTGDAQACRLALQAYSQVVAQLVASDVITLEAANVRFQALRDDVRVAGGVATVDAVFEELFPETASTDSSSPA